MFLIAITHSEISKGFQDLTVEELPASGFLITSVTDDFLSHKISTQKGVSITESPLMPPNQPTDSDRAILARVDFDRHNETIAVYKATNSGKTIYYHINSKGEFYCSTHISLLRKAGVAIEEENKVLPEYYVYGYVVPPLTLYKDIKQVCAGSRICVKLENGRCSLDSTDDFSLPEVNDEPSSLDTISGRVSDLVYQSIGSLHPRSENVSVLLSGGLDSSILYEMCKGLYDINTTYSTGYPFEDEGGNVDREYALSASKALGTTHDYLKATVTDYLEGIIEGIDAAEVPLAYTQSPMFYLLFRDGIPKDKNIVVCGQGAEGVFGFGLIDYIYGLTRMPWTLLSWRPFLRLIELAAPIAKHGSGFVRNVRSIRDYPISSPHNILWSFGAYASKEWVKRYFNTTDQDIISRRYDIIRPFEKRSVYEVISILDLLADAAATQAIWSKLGEKSGKILYYPYTDADLLTYVYAVPWRIRFHRPKNILRNVAYQKGIPEFIVTRRKSGFAIHPRLLTRWVGILDALVPLCREVINENEIVNLRSSAPNEAMTIWNILNYSIWKRLCIRNESVGVLLEQLKVTYPQ